MFVGISFLIVSCQIKWLPDKVAAR